MTPAGGEGASPASAPRVVSVEDGALDSVLAEVRGQLESHGLLGYPTETVYGFGGLVTGAAVERLFALKAREADLPVLLLIEAPGQLPGLLWTERAAALAAAFWPGPLTLVLPCSEGALPAGVVGQGGGVAVRRSPHPVAARLVQEFGPLTSTSANRRGAAPAATVGAVLEAARGLGAGPEMLILDGGPLEPSLPSTVVDLTGLEPVVLREGAIARSDLERSLPGIYASE